MTKVRKLAVVEKVPEPVVTPSQQAAKMMEHVRYSVEHDIKFANETLTKWGARFANNSADAFSWSSNIFDSAARKDVATYIKLFIEHLSKPEDEYSEKTDLQKLQAIRNELYRDVLHKARYPERSTSSQSNEMALAINAQKAEWLTKFDQYIDRLVNG